MATIPDMIRGGMNDAGIASVTGLPEAYIAESRERMRATSGALDTLAIVADSYGLSTLRKARATLAETVANGDILRDALRHGMERLNTIALRASCAPHDDEEKAAEAFTRIMREAYAMRDVLVLALEATR